MELLRKISALRSLEHDNILRFVGVVLDRSENCVLSEVATRGNLYDFLQGCDVNISSDFKLSLLQDIASGMRYLQNIISSHGQLSSRCCVINAKWACKISDYWINTLEPRKNVTLENISTTEAAVLLWTAPEVLQGNNVSPRSDVFSYSIIAQEVLLEDPPYGCCNNVDAQGIVHRVRNRSIPPCRPNIPLSSCTEEYKKLLEMCWNDNPDDRPSFSGILSKLRAMNGGTSISLADSMATRLEAHTRRLEDIVMERSMELADEKAITENLLCELLPKSVFEQLRAGNKVEPETFEQVTLFFSDIVSFTRISAAATPLDIVNFLNGLYSIFDKVIYNHDVYKVATIGDAYMVASGLPERNGDRHASEMARMSLELLKSVKNYQIQHIQGEYVKLRIGIHTGSCVAGVTGLKTPRYLLFGDTVNTASRLEALGEPMRIHVGDTTTALLQQDADLLLEPRGKIHVPGHGDMFTSWLIGSSRNTKTK